MKRIAAVILFLGTFSLCCRSTGAVNEPTPEQTLETTAADVRFRVEVVATGLEVPWAFAWLPSGDMLVTERPGRVRIIEKGKLRPEPVYVVPDVEPSGEAGLMDISLHPDFAANNFIYIAYAYSKGGEKRDRVVRYKYAAGKFTEPKTIIEDIPAASAHAGMRCRFGPDKKLYVTAGDSTNWNLAQDLSSLAGKILRLNDDGTVPADNPFAKQQGARPEIWTLGNRNPQGIAWQPGSGLAFETEHGPSSFEGKGTGGDEVNILEAGKNYGWPVIHHTDTKEGMVSPLLEYSPAPVRPRARCSTTAPTFQDSTGISFSDACAELASYELSSTAERSFVRRISWKTATAASVKWSKALTVTSTFRPRTATAAARLRRKTIGSSGWCPKVRTTRGSLAKKAVRTIIGSRRQSPATAGGSDSSIFFASARSALCSSVTVG